MLRPDWREAAEAFAANQKAREQKLADIRSLLPAPGKILRVKEFVALVQKLWEVLA